MERSLYQKIDVKPSTFWLFSINANIHNLSLLYHILMQPIIRLNELRTHKQHYYLNQRLPI